MAKIRLMRLVVPDGPREDWQIGKVIGMSHFGLSIGPLLKIRDIITGKIVKEFPMHVDELIRAP